MGQCIQHNMLHNSYSIQMRRLERKCISFFASSNQTKFCFSSSLMSKLIPLLHGCTNSRDMVFNKNQDDDFLIKELELKDPSIELLHQLLREQEHAVQNENFTTTDSSRGIMMRRQKRELERKTSRSCVGYFTLWAIFSIAWVIQFCFIRILDFNFIFEFDFTRNNLMRYYDK